MSNWTNRKKIAVRGVTYASQREVAIAFAVDDMAVTRAKRNGTLDDLGLSPAERRIARLRRELARLEGRVGS